MTLLLPVYNIIRRKNLFPSYSILLANDIALLANSESELKRTKNCY